MKKVNRLLCFLLLLVPLLQGCSEKKGLGSLSPMEIVDTYHAASGEGNLELLRRIVYFPPNATEEEINKKVGYNMHSNIREDTKSLTSMLGIKIVSRYEKILDDNTAEVGIGVQTGVGPLGKFTPVDQMILKRDSGIWKIDYSKGQLEQEELIEIIKKDVRATWAYYYLGVNIQSENPYKASKYYKRYYELEPDGFYVTDDLLDRISKYGDMEKAEQEQLEIIQRERWDEGKVSHYIDLCLLFMENNELEKAEMYLQKADDIIKEQHGVSPLDKQDFEKAKKELALRKSGQYHDILDEIEAKQKK